MAVHGQVLGRAAALVTGHGLRAYDGVQLACAAAARAADPQVDAFLCFDTVLNEAAAREGFSTSCCELVPELRGTPHSGLTRDRRKE